MKLCMLVIVVGNKPGFRATWLPFVPSVGDTLYANVQGCDDLLPLEVTGRSCRLLTAEITIDVTGDLDPPYMERAGFYSTPNEAINNQGPRRSL